MFASTPVLETPMARKKLGRPVTSNRDDVPVKLDRDVAADLRWIAEKRKISLAEYLTELLKPIRDREMAKMKGGDK